MMIEQDTRFIIDNNLVNKGWILDINDPRKNVFFENDINRIIENSNLVKIKKRPDYVLIDTNKNPVAVIEAKAGGKSLDKALVQASAYAEILKAPLIFAMNNSYCQTKHLYLDKPLYINESEVNELITQKEILKFIEENTNSIYTIPKNIIVSRQELINVFKKLNNELRGEGLRAGIERLSEFANILFLKLYTENRAEHIWNSIKRVDNEILINTVNQGLKHINKKYGTSIFVKLQIKKAATLRKIINYLDGLVLSSIDSDIKGDAFEYFLQQATATNNDLGEYFTPRHIAKMVINLINPKFKESIYDPFCGTGGFLTQAFNYINENNIIKTDVEKKILRKKTVFGREITTNSRLAKMNMVLHGDGHSGVHQIDSLLYPVKHKYDVVVTNMPFSQTTKFSHLYYNNMAKNKADAVCVLHCFQATRKGGRLAIIVPEGFLFNKNYMEIRKFLLENSVLKAIVSLPNGIFLPYTGVKTSILFLNECHIKKTKKSIWYFDIKNDGFSLDNHRKKIRENNLKKLGYINFNKSTDENIKDIGFQTISFDEIERNNYNLVLNKYIKENYKSKFDLIKLESVIDLLRGPFGSSIKKSVCVSKGYKLYEQRNVIDNDFSKGEYYLSKEKFEKLQKFEIKKDDVLMTCAGTLGRVAIVPKIIERGIINSVLMRLRIINKDVIIPEYLKILLETDLIKYELVKKSVGTGIKNMRPGKELKELLLPIPGIRIQKTMVDKVLKKRNSISKKKEEIKTIERSIANDINSVWER